MNSIYGISAFIILVNIVAFILVGVDKKKSVVHSERVPEVYFFFLASCFASLGVLLGMFVFHHKTQKIYFPVGIGLLLLQQITLVLFLTGALSPLM